VRLGTQRIEAAAAVSVALTARLTLLYLPQNAKATTINLLISQLAQRKD
jgi:hypothetical protein